MDKIMKIEYTTLVIISLAYVTANLEKYSQKAMLPWFVLALVVVGVIRAISVWKNRKKSKSEDSPTNR